MAMVTLAAKVRSLNTSKVIFNWIIIKPAHEIMVLITYATGEGSGEPAHLRRIARAFVVRTHEVCK